jgi:NTP pyrophosphatase (non-canonical NTP hydrolase)
MNLKELTDEMNKFVENKGWYSVDSSKPQTLRNLAISLNLEAAEVLELFQWQENPKSVENLANELADVTLYLLQIASVSGIDLEKAIQKKLEINYTRNWDE